MIFQHIPWLMQKPVFPTNHPTKQNSAATTLQHNKCKQQLLKIRNLHVQNMECRICLLAWPGIVSAGESTDICCRVSGSCSAVQVGSAHQWGRRKAHVGNGKVYNHVWCRCNAKAKVRFWLAKLNPGLGGFCVIQTGNGSGLYHNSRGPHQTTAILNKCTKLMRLKQWVRLTEMTVTRMVSRLKSDGSPVADCSVMVRTVG